MPGDIATPRRVPRAPVTRRAGLAERGAAAGLSAAIGLRDLGRALVPVLEPAGFGGTPLDDWLDDRLGEALDGRLGWGPPWAGPAWATALPEPGGSALRPPAPSGDGEPDRVDEVPALVSRAQSGDAEAFGQLYDHYVDLVYRYIYYRVGSRALAEDLTSETFLRALRRVGSFTWQGRDIGAWFVTIARNLVADHYKSGRYRLEVQVADMLDADRAQDGPEGEVLDALTNRTLLEAVKRLNAEQQECIVLRFLQGLSVAETALAMGKNEGAIKALQYRAVRTLGRLLPDGFTP